MKNLIFVLLTFLLLSIDTEAKIVLPSVLADNMVLQQQTKVNLWGKASPNAKLSVKTSWNKHTVYTTVGADGRWKLSVETPKAGGPYQIVLNDGEPWFWIMY